MGFYLEIQNRRASKYEYFKERGGANSTWMSRNMIWSGLVILSFLVLHFIDFWFPEMNYKYIEFKPEDPNRYYEELIHKFEDIRRVVFYCISFVLLSLHLLHGFSSSLKSMGANKSYASSVKNLSVIYSVGVPLGFCFIAIFHHLTH
jgi:succinate dehydrogenase / fumarate reductase cytochrome b subunit